MERCRVQRGCLALAVVVVLFAVCNTLSVLMLWVFDDSMHHQGGSFLFPVFDSPTTTSIRPSTSSSYAFCLEYVDPSNAWDSRCNISLALVGSSEGATFSILHDSLRRRYHRNDVTLVFFATDSQLPHVQQMMVEWRGPVVILLYAPSHSSQLLFEKYVSQHLRKLLRRRGNTLIARVLGCLDKSSCDEKKCFVPSSSLMNLGIELANTQFILTASVNYLPSLRSYETLIQELPLLRLLGPNFVFLFPSIVGSGPSIMRPLNRQALLEAIERGGDDTFVAPTSNERDLFNISQWISSNFDGDYITPFNWDDNVITPSKSVFDTKGGGRYGFHSKKSSPFRKKSPSIFYRISLPTIDCNDVHEESRFDSVGGVLFLKQRNIPPYNERIAGHMYQHAFLTRLWLWNYQFGVLKDVFFTRFPEGEGEVIVDGLSQHYRVDCFESEEYFKV